ncbi:hypothetical protein Lal_00025566 [Lupinus albus]|uniref:Uncharacterized protein n=1 Tax=Lupinus albus TaxID=3870 RepID=A0A6A5NZ05_LUPAL|nr:hypothetical protein Lalb_Chr10g0102121 [Lupinus albus]KAF1890233.1 hypothetical protein Lal_00025566 [Lupinus albus]
MATIGSGLAETYVMRKIYREKMKKIAQEEEVQGERRTNMKNIHTTTKGSSSGCFSWLSKQQGRKNSRISNTNENEAANT